jgi:hypothetical protein
MRSMVWHRSDENFPIGLRSIVFTLYRVWGVPITEPIKKIPSHWTVGCVPRTALAVQDSCRRRQSQVGILLVRGRAAVCCTLASSSEQSTRLLPIVNDVECGEIQRLFSSIKTKICGQQRDHVKYSVKKCRSTRLV